MDFFLTLWKNSRKLWKPFQYNHPFLPPTIYDIAREAKVGIGTVSRVFNDHPSVSSVTRERVLRIAHRLNYRPHPYAQGLARKRTNAVMAFIPFYTTFFFMEILQGVQASLAELDIDLLLVGVNHLDQLEEALHHNLQRSRVDGMLFFSMQLPDSLAASPIAQRIPLILVDSFHPRFDSLSVDNKEGARRATKHLISLGHRRIGMLSANLESIPARDRLLGFRQAMDEARLPVGQEFVKSTTSTKLDGFTSESGYETMLRYIALGDKMPTALLVSSDIQAVGALGALTENGLRCPQDISLVGFDDIELATHLGLTTMRQPLYQMGQLAAQAFLARQKQQNRKPIHTTFAPELIVRKTSGGPGSRSLSVRRRTRS